MKTLLLLIILTIPAYSATVDYNGALTPLALIIDGEGWRGGIYTDTEGYATCGYGFRADLHPCERLTTPDQGIAYLQLILPIYTNIARDYHTDTNAVVNAVLTDLAYNIGQKINKFEDMLKALKEGNYQKAAYELRNSLYCEQTRTRCERNARILEQQ